MPTLHWMGKDKVVKHHHEVPFKTLRREYIHTTPEGTPANSTGNRIIHGDNLEALKALLPEFEGRVNCIYIDPPYNTGNEGWVYNDNVNDPRIQKWLHQVVGKEGEDLSRHDKWLCMMYPRLKLLHRLLAEDGSIWISIDDNEQAYLKLIMDEIFGQLNFIANIVWKKKTNGNNVGHIPPVHDFIVCYAKNQDRLALSGVRLSTEYIEGVFLNPDNDPRGPWKTTDLSANHKGPYFEITNPLTGEVHLPPKGRYWVFNADEINKRINDGRIIFGKTGKTKPVQRVFLKDKTGKRKAETWWDKHGLNSDGMQELSNILGTKVFDHPKPSITLQHIIDIATQKDSLVLDSFAGSGTTAHAVLKLNAQDGGNRRFILTEMMDYAETITAERVRRVMNGYGTEDKPVPGLGGSFEYYTIGEALFDEDGNLNEAVPVEEIRRYVAYTEGVEYGLSEMSPYFIGQSGEAAYLFHYELDQATTLDFAFLSTLKLEKESRPTTLVIYADNCLLSQDQLQKHGIIFKKIPRDITRF